MKRILITLMASLVVWSCGKQAAVPELICVEINDLWGYINVKGEMVIAPQFESAFPFTNGLALIEREEDGYGYINEKGELVKNLQGFKAATPFSEGMAVVVRPLECPEVINTSGKVLFRIQEAEEVYGFSEGLCLFSTKVKTAVDSGDDKYDEEIRYGFLNAKGKVVIPAKFEKAYPFMDGLSIALSDEGLCGFIDMKGNWVINPLYSDVRPFSEDLAAVEDKSTGLWGFIDKNGKMRIQPQFQACGPFQEGLALAVSGKLAGYINKNGKFAIQPQFEDADLRSSGFSQGMAVALMPGEEVGGYINKKGLFKIMQVVGYPFKCSLTPAMTLDTEKMGIIDKKGTFVVSPIYDEIKWDYYEFDDGIDVNNVYHNPMVVRSDYVDMTWLETGGEWNDNPFEYDSDSYTFNSAKKTVKKYILEQDKTVEGSYSLKDRYSMLVSYKDGTKEEIEIDLTDQRIKVGKDWLYSKNGTAYDERMRREFKLYGGGWFSNGEIDPYVWCHPESNYSRVATTITFYEFPSGTPERNNGSFPLSEATHSITLSVKNGRDLLDSSSKTVAKVEPNWPYDGFSVSGDLWYSGSYSDQ